MRIHWALVVLAVIGTILLTWHLRTRDMDFLTPGATANRLNPPAKEIVEAQPAAQPEIKKNPGPGELIPAEPTDDVPAEVPRVPEITENDLGDLEAGPGLSEYRSFAQKGSPEALFELSSTLRARGHFQRALLALERIIDTTSASPEILAEAGQGIAALTPTLPRWNIDPEATIELELHLSLSRPASEALRNAVAEVARLIEDSSGDQLAITPKLSEGDKPDAPADSPVALWLSSSGENPITSSVITVRLPGEDSLVPALSQALFRAIRSQLGRLGFPKTTAAGEDGAHLLSTQITRFMWRELARSLTPEPPEGETPPREEDDDAPSSETD